MKKLTQLALEDFGRTDIPAKIRGLARKIARENSCTAKEALPLAIKQLDEMKKRDKAIKELGEKLKESKAAYRKVNKQKKRAKIGQPKFSGLVQGGAPGLGKKK